MDLRPNLLGFLNAPVFHRKTISSDRIKMQSIHKLLRWTAYRIPVLIPFGYAFLSIAIGPPENHMPEAFEVTHLVTPECADDQPKDRRRNPDTVPPAQALWP